MEKLQESYWVGEEGAGGGGVKEYHLWKIWDFHSANFGKFRHNLRIFGAFL